MSNKPEPMSKPTTAWERKLSIVAAECYTCAIPDTPANRIIYGGVVGPAPLNKYAKQLHIDAGHDVRPAEGR